MGLASETFAVVGMASEIFEEYEAVVETSTVVTEQLLRISAAVTGLAA